MGRSCTAGAPRKTWRCTRKLDARRPCARRWSRGTHPEGELREERCDGPQRVLGPRRKPSMTVLFTSPGSCGTASAACPPRGTSPDDVEGSDTAPRSTSSTPPSSRPTPWRRTVAHAAAHALLLVVRAERRDHPGGEHVVHELEEALVRDVVIGEQKHHLLVPDADARVQRLEVVAEHLLVVPARERDLEGRTPRCTPRASRGSASRTHRRPRVTRCPGPGG